MNQGMVYIQDYVGLEQNFTQENLSTAWNWARNEI